MTLHHRPLLLKRIEAHGNALALTDEAGKYTYADVLSAAHRIAGDLLEANNDLAEKPVAFMATPGFDYTATMLGIWCAGGIAVPLCEQYPAREIEYVLDDTKAELLLASTEHAARLQDLNGAERRRVRTIQDSLEAESRTALNISDDRRAMILYTSGTTSRPKGVVTTHRNIAAQIESLIEAWEWTSNDRILPFLPLHHVHGIINVLCCSLWAGATCDVLPNFDAERVWGRISLGRLTLLMAVPTIDVKLIAAWNESNSDEQRRYSQAASKLRLMVSGSAALPVSVLEHWKSITGQTLLERYGMTESGMALSNPLHGERKPGAVGTPLPGVDVMLADEVGGRIESEGVEGEICVRGDTVFKEYWGKEEVTQSAFRDGWFLTGDISIINDGTYRILGRNSVDIIKSGGYKISALEIEEVLRTHPDIEECAVVGIPDDEWGERVSVAAVPKTGRSIALGTLRKWAADKLAKYKIPSSLLVVDELPRNVMGKVMKPEVQGLFNEQAKSRDSALQPIIRKQERN